MIFVYDQLDIPNVNNVNLPESFERIESVSISSEWCEWNVNVDVHESLRRYVTLPPTPTPTPFCEKGKDLLILNRFYSTNPSEEQFKLYEGIRSEK